MKSKHVETFNHDPWAEGYDADVLNEADPIRAGYEALLTWVAQYVPEKEKLRVADLGSGTGNLTVRLPTTARITAVDTSVKMMNIAQTKLVRHSVSYVEEDILAWLTAGNDPFDAFVSTYALHHLTTDEKVTALEAMTARLNPGGSIAIGDLMFASTRDREAILAQFTESGQSELVEDIIDEFFWDLEEDCRLLKAGGGTFTHRRFSTLSHGFVYSS